jgi:hypothetical protein
MKTEKEESLMNDRSHPRAEELADLPVTDEQAQLAKGGADLTTSESTNSQGWFRYTTTNPSITPGG